MKGGKQILLSQSRLLSSYTCLLPSHLLPFCTYPHLTFLHFLLLFLSRFYLFFNPFYIYSYILSFLPYLISFPPPFVDLSTLLYPSFPPTSYFTHHSSFSTYNLFFLVSSILPSSRSTLIHIPSLFSLPTSFSISPSSLSTVIYILPAFFLPLLS